MELRIDLNKSYNRKEKRELLKIYVGVLNRRWRGEKLYEYFDSKEEFISVS